jgi:hypothetical protein
MQRDPRAYHQLTGLTAARTGGQRDEVAPTTTSSTQSAPALTRSVRMLRTDVTHRPRTTSASIIRRGRWP